VCKVLVRVIAYMFSPIKVIGSICITCFNVLKLCILPTECIYVLLMVVIINSDYLND
jgi:hypothetical protein